MPKRKQQSDQDEIEIVNAQMLAKLIGVSTRRVTQMVEDGIAVKIKTGQYDLIKSLHNYHEMLRTGRTGGGAAADKGGYVDPIKDLKHKMALLEYESAAGKLVNKEQVFIEVAELAANTRSDVMAVSDRAPSMLVGKGLEDIRLILRRELGSALRTIKDV